MAASSAARPEHAAHTDVTGAVLVVVGLTLLLPGLLAFFAPGAFDVAIAGYPPENGHFLRDIGTMQIALGMAALLAWRLRGLRVAVLAVLAVQFALHAVSHVIDVDESEPAWQGPFALVALLLGAAVLVALLVKEQRS